jgi:hypothetical protein
MSKLPDFTNDISSMSAALRTLKLAVEILGGMRQGEGLGAPIIYAQGNPPERNKSFALRPGDLWIDTDTDKLNYWNGKIWREVL